MICDTLDNLYKYVPRKIVEKVQTFIEQIQSDMLESDYEIQGRDAFARVMSYSGKAREVCEIEAHNRYVDIQFTLQGVEGIEIFTRQNLKSKTDYSEKDDVQFFEESEEPYITIDNLPGRFSMIFPKEAHRPQIATTYEGVVIKKGVIKIKEELFDEK